MALWSHSRLETFRQCPRKYFYRYVARVRLPVEPETIEQFAGSRAHDALEWLYGEVQRGRAPSAEQLVGRLRRDWDAGWHDAITMPGGERPPEEHREEVERWLRDHHERHAPFTASRTLGLEQRITFALDEAGSVRMRGVIDRLAIGTDGTWQIHDYKTNRRLPAQEEKDADPQLAYYELGVRRMWPDQVERVELVWHFLKFGVSITSRRTEAQLAGLREAALGTIADAEGRGRSESAFPTRESRLCDWCEFQSICPVRKHLVKVAELPGNRFLEEPGVKLVDHWAALDEQRKELRRRIDELEAEIDQVKEALARYAEREGAEVVAGSDREASVRTNEAVVFPRKSVEEEAGEAAALERQLRGSSWWGDASTVDRAALARLWARRDELDRDLRALLEEFARTEVAVDVRLRKRRS
jgi:putative RecB family exonuclease